MSEEQETLESLRTKVQVLKAAVKDKINLSIVVAQGTCAFCDFEYDALNRDTVAAHSQTCPNHPMRQLEAALAAAHATAAASEAATLRLTAENAKLRGLLGRARNYWMDHLGNCHRLPDGNACSCGRNALLGDIDAALAHGQPGAAGGNAGGVAG